MMMACGHASNGKDMETGKPVCVICQCEDQIKDPCLLGRIAKCGICGTKQESGVNLPFFEYRPSKLEDRFYDGCFGWD